MKLLQFPLFLLGILLPVFAGATELKLADIFGNEMVLQRDIAVPVWGIADPGAEISVAFAGQKISTRADDKGVWSLKLSPLVASAENRIFTVVATPLANATKPPPTDAATPAAAASAAPDVAPDAAPATAIPAVPEGPKTIELKNVLVGEVWLCSGQSNMEQGIVYKGTNNGAQEASQANFPLIRLRLVSRQTAVSPKNNLQGSPWQPCSPESIRKGGWGGFSAAGYFFGREIHQKLNVPVGLIQSAWGGTRIEPWTTPDGFRSVNGLKQLATQKPRAKDNGSPSSLYNAMIHPIIPYAIRGALWYQGEANLAETDYAAKTRALVQGWRGAWKQGEFPFYFVQLAPYIYGKSSPERLPISWEQQTRALEIPNTGMAIINDVGNLHDIHTGNKQTVGARLARLALSRTYGVKFADDSGPVFKSASITGPGKITVEFAHAASGLSTRDDKAATYFELAGKDGIFHPATSVTFAGNTAEVFCEELAAVKQVRFAWTQAAEPNLVNGEQLPAGAFRWSALAGGSKK
jgi:sialate O-acetylesterase